MLRKSAFAAPIFFLLSTTLSGFAGQDAPKKADPAPDYSKESSIILSAQTHLRFSADGSSVRTQTTSVKMLSEAGVKEWGVLGAAYASENEHLDVHYVRVHKADGATVVTPAANVLDLPSDVTREAPMYSDLKQKQIPVKALGVGDTLEFELAFVEDKPLVPGQFWYSFNFTRNTVVLKESIEVRVPRDKLPKIANAGLKPVITDEGAERVYTWTTSNAEPTKPAGAGDEVEKQEQPDVQFSTFQSWQQVGEWYGKLAQSQAAVTPEIQARADALVKGIAPGPARIQAIYDFVSSHIRYIGLSFGIGRYQPHTATDVLENEYGDCKDKHTLLAALLKAEGIEAWPVLIHNSQKLDEDIPSPGQFDHLITLVPQGKQYLWLDTTPEVAPYGMLLSGLRDKQALVVPLSGAPFLLKTPADPPFPGEDRVSMRGELTSEGTFKGHLEMTLRGDSEVVYRMVFHASARAKWQDVLQVISYRLGFGGEVSNVQVDDPDATRLPFHLSYDYQRKKYGDWDNRQISPPMPGLPINLVNEDKKPKSPMQVGSAGTTIYTSDVTLPAGSTMEAPPDVDLKTAFAEYHARYSVANGKFLAERRFILLKGELPVEDWQSFVAFQKEVTADYGRMSSVGAGGNEPAVATAKDTPEAADLIQKAFQSFQEHELNLAEDQLDKAKKLNPHQTSLYAGYGSLYLMQGKTDDGIEAFRKEMKEHPENLRVLRGMGKMLSGMHRDDEAIDVYQSLLKRVPDDVDATTELARLLVSKERWKDAQPVLENATKLRPDNAQIQVWYGQSCLKAGKEAEGLTALKSAAENSTDPAMLSSIAATLADAGKALDVAQHAAQRALALIEDETASFTLDAITNPQMRKMTDLAQVWDRMSWVAFKAGDLAVAEKYALAAWTLAQEPAAGDHLGQIYEKQGKLTQALDVYKMARARAYPPVPGLEERDNALRKRVGSSASNADNGVDRLQKMRIVHLPRLKPLSASADFLVLFAGGKVSEVKMLGGDQKLEPYGSLLKQARFNAPFPDQGPERVVRQGVLSCSAYDPDYMFLMMLPADASTYSRSPVPIHAGETKVIQVQP
jgi:tetratricopeptide (TPR) repeat protein